jgi:protein gp37
VDATEHFEPATPGCEFCFSERQNKWIGTGLPFKPGHRNDVELFLDKEMLLSPLRWRRPRMIFVCSMTDLFADFVPDEWIDRMFSIMTRCPQHKFQVLTKRCERMRRYLSIADDAEAWRVHLSVQLDVLGAGYIEQQDWKWPLPNLWVGVSSEDQRRADERIPDLLATPAAVRFVSYEPALGPINLHSARCRETGSCSVRPACLGGLDWFICGGESGPRARPMHPSWVRAARDQCVAANVSFFMKQWGEWVEWLEAGVSQLTNVTKLEHFPLGLNRRGFPKACECASLRH